MPQTMPHDILSRMDSIQAACRHFIVTELLRQGIEDVVPSHGALLAYLHQAGCPVQVMSLVVALHRPKSTITKATDCLEESGYLCKKPNPADGRSYLVELTPVGESFFEIYQDIVRKLESKAFTGMEVEDKYMFERIIGSMETNLL